MTEAEEQGHLIILRELARDGAVGVSSLDHHLAIESKLTTIKSLRAEIESSRAERDQLRDELDSVRRAAMTIHAMNVNLIRDSNRVYIREQNVDAQVESVQAANATLTEENEKLRDRVGELEQRLLVTDEILTAKIGVDAGKAIIEGRAAVVPVDLPTHVKNQLYRDVWENLVGNHRLDKPMENK